MLEQRREVGTKSPIPRGSGIGVWRKFGLRRGQAETAPPCWVRGSGVAGREGVDAGGLSRRRPVLSGAAWFPRFGAGLKCA